MSRIGPRTFIKQAAAAGVALSGGLAGPLAALAQDGWPNRPVKFIVPLAPGPFAFARDGTFLVACALHSVSRTTSGSLEKD
jgi:hypothetical protein